MLEKYGEKQKTILSGFIKFKTKMVFIFTLRFVDCTYSTRFTFALVKMTIFTDVFQLFHTDFLTQKRVMPFWLWAKVVMRLYIKWMFYDGISMTMTFTKNVADIPYGWRHSHVFGESWVDYTLPFSVTDMTTKRCTHSLVCDTFYTKWNLLLLRSFIISNLS